MCVARLPDFRRTESQEEQTHNRQNKGKQQGKQHEPPPALPRGVLQLPLSDRDGVLKGVDGAAAPEDKTPMFVIRLACFTSWSRARFPVRSGQLDCNGLAPLAWMLSAVRSA